ncbi:hypothetical protein D3C81_1758810 [compost metagenome]
MSGAFWQTAVFVQRIQQALLRQFTVLIQPAQHNFIRVQPQRFTERQITAVPIAFKRRKVMRRRDCH